MVQEFSVSPHRLMAAMVTLRDRRAAMLEADPDLADDENDLMDALQTDSREEAKAMEVIYSLCRAALLLRHRADRADDMLKNLKARRDRYEDRYEKLRDLLQDVMTTIGEKRLVQPDFTVTRKATLPKVIITDEAKLPHQYVRTKVVTTPDKAALRAAMLEDGEIIAGCVMGNAGETLLIRGI